MGDLQELSIVAGSLLFMFPFYILEHFFVFSYVISLFHYIVVFHNTVMEDQ